MYRALARAGPLLPVERSQYLLDAMTYCLAGIAAAALVVCWVWPLVYRDWVYVPLHVPLSPTGNGGCADGKHHVVIMSEREIKTVLDNNKMIHSPISPEHDSLSEHLEPPLQYDNNATTRELLQDCAQKDLPGDLSKVPCFAPSSSATETSLDLTGLWKEREERRLKRAAEPSLGKKQLPVGSMASNKRNYRCADAQQMGAEYARAVRANFAIQDDMADARTSLLSAIDDRDNERTAHLARKVLELDRRHERTLAKAQKVLHGKDGIDPEATGVPAESLLEAAAECTDPKWWHNTTKHITGNKRAGRAAKRTGATDAAAERRLRAAAAQKRNPGLR